MPIGKSLSINIGYQNIVLYKTIHKRDYKKYFIYTKINTWSTSCCLTSCCFWISGTVIRWWRTFHWISRSRSTIWITRGWCSEINARTGITWKKRLPMNKKWLITLNVVLVPMSCFMGEIVWCQKMGQNLYLLQLVVKKATSLLIIELRLQNKNQTKKIQKLKLVL